MGERPLQDRGGEGRVDGDRNGSRLADDVLDIDQGEGRIAGSLDEDQGGVGPERRRDLVGLDEAHLEAEQPRGEQVIGPAVERPDGDHVATVGRGAGGRR